MECPKKFFFLGAFLVTSILVEVAVVTSKPTVPEILTKYGLPVGLLPASVKNYTLANNGDFVVELEEPCEVQINYLVSYDSVIQGTLSYGKITDLSGIRAKKILVWMHVTGIDVDIPSSGYIYFHVGQLSKKLDISWFKSVPTCKVSSGKLAGNDIKPELVQRAVE